MCRVRTCLAIAHLSPAAALTGILFAPMPAEQSVNFVAIADHVAKTDDDLMFLKGEKVTLVKKVSDDIWEVRIPVAMCVIGGSLRSFLFRANARASLAASPPNWSSRPIRASSMTTQRVRAVIPLSIFFSCSCPLLRSGVCIRALKDSEIPLFVQYNWKFQKSSANNTFLLKEREVEVRENATKEMYIGLSVAKLQGLLKDLDHQEKRALDEITTKYDKQSAGFKKALAEAKKHSA